MDSIILGISVVLPLLMLMSFGYFLKTIKVFDETFLKKLNSVCFKVFIPMLLFQNIYSSNFNIQESLKIVIFVIASVLILTFILLSIIKFITKENKNKGVVIQGILRSNIILYGLPVMSSLFSDTSAMLVLITVFVPLSNILSVIILKKYSPLKTKENVFISVIKNQVVLAAIIAFAMHILGIRLLPFMEEAIKDISSIATPLSLIVLGGSFKFKELFDDAKLLFITLSIKSFLIPIVMVPVVYLFNFRGSELVALSIMFSAPTAVSSYAMATQAKANDKLASQIVVFTSILSIITISILVSTLNYFNLI